MNTMKIVCGYVLFLFFIIPMISGIGVGSRYTSSDFIELMIGEEINIILSLQNADVKGGIDLKPVVDVDDLKVSFDKLRYTVPYKGKTTSIMNIKVPKGVKVGGEYVLRYTFEQDSLEGEGMITLGRKISRSFNVRIIDENSRGVHKIEDGEEGLLNYPAVKKSFGWIIMIITLVMVVVVILFFVFKIKKDRDRFKGVSFRG